MVRFKLNFKLTVKYLSQKGCHTPVFTNTVFNEISHLQQTLLLLLLLLISKDLKWDKQVDKAVKTANIIIAQIRNSFSYLDTELVKMLYVALVRPHLEFAVAVWNPHLKKDIEKLEKIQHKATRMSSNIRDKKYKERLKIMKLTSLENRRMRGDLIQFFKILNGIDQIKWRKDPNLISQGSDLGPSGNLRNKKYCFLRESAKICYVRENFFLNRVIPIWNDLPFEVKNSKTVNSFKAKLDKLELFIYLLRLS